MLTPQSPPPVIFDMDGVLIDSEPLHEEAQRIVFARNQIDVPESVFTDFKGQTEEDVFEYVVRQFGNGSHVSGRLIAEKHAEYSRMIERMELIGGALDCLRFLDDRGHRMALTTSAVRNDQERAFERFGLGPFFQVVVTAEDVRRPKPDPEPYQITARRLGVEPRDCAVIEDSINGVRSARDAGCHVIALTTSISAQELDAAGASAVHDSFDTVIQELSATGHNEL